MARPIVNQGAKISNIKVLIKQKRGQPTTNSANKYAKRPELAIFTLFLALSL